MKASEYRDLDLANQWAQAADEALLAAQMCRDKSVWRSSINRSYYASYSYLSSLLAKVGVDFRADRVGPEHEVLAELIDPQLNDLFQNKRQRSALKIAIRALYKARITADYHPHRLLSQEDAVAALKNARTIEKIAKLKLR